MNLKLILNRAPLFTEDELKDLDGKVVCQGCRRPNVTGVIQCTCGEMTSDVPETLQELQNLELKHSVRHNHARRFGRASETLSNGHTHGRVGQPVRRTRVTDQRVAM